LVCLKQDLILVVQQKQVEKLNCFLAMEGLLEISSKPHRMWEAVSLFGALTFHFAVEFHFVKLGVFQG